MIESHWRRWGDLEGATWWIARAGALLLLAAALALAPLRWTVLLIAAVAGGLAILVHPWLVLLVIAWAAPFGPLVPLPIAGATADVNELLMAALAGAWVAQGAVRRQIVIPCAPLQTPILLLLGAYGFSLLGAWSLRDGLVESVKWVEGALLYLATIALLPRRRAPWLVGAILAAGAAQAAVGLVQFVRAIGPSQFIVLGRFVRAYGTFQQPNPFGGYLGLLAPVALSLTGWAAWRVAAAWRGAGRWAALTLAGALAAATFLIYAGLIASWSRGAWMGAAAALVALVVAQGRRATAAALAVGLVASAVVVLAGGRGGAVATALIDRLASPESYVAFTDPRTVEITDANFATVQRLAQWQAAWGMFSDHPWLGVGIGNYAAAYPAYALPRWYLVLGHAHNYYLNAAAETGLVGLAAYLLLGAAASLWVVRWVRRGVGWPRALAIGVLGALTHLSVHNLVDNLYVQHMILILALLIGSSATVNDPHLSA
jgi:putative inorganic carbon (HCO3(-)) transporter